MTESKLVTKVIQAHKNNFTKDRINNGIKVKISEITLHHMAGCLSIEGCGALWQDPNRKGSSNYGINGLNIGQYVSELDASWCNSNFAANCRSVTIEIANSPEVSGKTYAETIAKGDKLGWPVTDDSLKTTIKLVADIAKRNDLHPLVLGKTLTWHNMYSATSCPGPHLMGKLQYIVDEANRINAEKEINTEEDLYGVMRQAIALTGEEKAQAYANKLNSEDKTSFYKIVKIEK